ncbi:uncharacterized protein LOC133553313 isoform X1 [Nerophis ophidion]|uniref:uncharacterized protein LOC133553313 isoform X1 n=1 Tax=Nerophis ophidion TaxID=159077 RepID=UPI002AE060E2|nr:uncharacterized protein LOC133553313 isoform X1 [Nerophis ophidion]
MSSKPLSPLAKKAMKVVIVVELLGIFGAYKLFHMMDTSQDFRSTMNRRFPSILEGSHRSHLHLGAHEGGGGACGQSVATHQRQSAGSHAGATRAHTLKCDSPGCVCTRISVDARRHKCVKSMLPPQLLSCHPTHKHAVKRRLK